MDTERAELEAAAGVGVCGDEEKVVAHGKGRDVGCQLREGVGGTRERKTAKEGEKVEKKEERSKREIETEGEKGTERERE